MNMEKYIIKSNYEEAPRQENEVGFHTKLDTSQSDQCQMGNGRSDILIRYPNWRGKAVIIEIKVAKEISKLEDKCNEALAQIESKHYDAQLIQEGYKDVLKYGVAFYKKDCMVRIQH